MELNDPFVREDMAVILGEHHKKRNFAWTTEPSQAMALPQKREHKPCRYVVQKH